MNSAARELFSHRIRSESSGLSRVFGSFSNRKFLFGLLLFSVAVFVIRGPVRAYRYRNAWVDFASPYLESRTWSAGINPYNPTTYETAWRLTGGYGLEKLGGLGTSSTPYSPTLLPLMVPLAEMPWTVARVIWIAISCFLILVLAQMAILAAGTAVLEQKLLLFALVLLAPASQTLIWTGNLTLLAASCGLAAFYWGECRDRGVLAGILVALSIAAKPQIGVWVLLFGLFSRRWKAVGSALASLTVLLEVFCFGLRRSGFGWLHAYFSVFRDFAASGATDFSAANPRRFNLLNVQVILSTFFDDRNLANLLGLFLVGTLLVYWLWHFRKTKAQDERLLAFATLLTISILPYYHRIYDTILLIAPAAWSLVNFPISGRLLKFIRILLALFLLPTGSGLVALLEANRIPDSIAHKWWWSSFVMPHQNWLLVFLSIALLIALRNGTSMGKSAIGEKVS